MVQLAFMLLGTLFLVLGMVLITRIVSNIHLMPNAKQVKIGHLNMFGFNRASNFKIIDLEAISSKQPRFARRTFISLQIRNKFLDFLIDTDGKFHNEEIYDQTIGLQRIL